MPKPCRISGLFCIVFVALGAQPALANEREYIQCFSEGSGSSRPFAKYILDEANSTVQRDYDTPQKASFTEDKVNWGHSPGLGWTFHLNRKNLSLVYTFGQSTTQQCEKIPPYDRGEIQRWTISALSLHCTGSGPGEGNSPTIELKGQMRLDVSHPTTKSRVVFNVTSKKGYRRIFCDGRQHKATDTTPFVLEGSPRDLAGDLWRVRINFDEIDFGSPIRAIREYKQGGLAQAHWPETQLTSGWKPLPHETRLNNKGYSVLKYVIPKRIGQPDLFLRIEFKRVE